MRFMVTSNLVRGNLVYDLFSNIVRIKFIFIYFIIIQFYTNIYNLFYRETRCSYRANSDRTKSDRDKSDSANSDRANSDRDNSNRANSDRANSDRDNSYRANLDKG